MSEGIKSGILRIFLANIINLLFNLLTNLLLPKYLTEDCYAILKLFQLYISYAGILHLGFLDGAYLKYGGQKFTNINPHNLHAEISTFRIFQFCLSVPIGIFAIFIKDYVLLAFAFSVLPYNDAQYIKTLFQATGEFKKYANITNITVFVTFLANMLLIFWGLRNKGNIFIFIYVLIYIGIWIYLEIILSKVIPNIKMKRLFSMKIVIDNIKMGFFLMLGNFSSILLTSMDRWFIKIFMSLSDFAQYSFAVSMEGIMSVVISPISITMYNYFCKEHDVAKMKRVQNCIIIFASFVVACAFPAKWVLEVYLKNYIASAKVMFWLFAAHIFSIIIKCIYVNLYKVNRMQKKYFNKLIIIIICSFMYNIVALKVLGSKEGLAIATMFATITWFLLCLKDFGKIIKCGVPELIYLFSATVAFLFFGINFNAINGFIFYSIFLLIISLLLLKRDFKFLFQTIFQLVSKVIRKQNLH